MTDSSTEQPNQQPAGAASTVRSPLDQRLEVSAPPGSRSYRDHTGQLRPSAAVTGAQCVQWQSAGCTSDGEIQYRWASDRDLDLRLNFANGEVLSGTIGWPSAELARTHRQDAVASFARRGGNLSRGSIAGQKRRVRRLTLPRGALYLGVNTGPPTWWKPRGLKGRTNDGAARVMLGWLNACVYATYEPRQTAN